MNDSNSVVVGDIPRSQRQRRTGQCTVCLRHLSLTASGLVHQHGPGCAGNGCPPVDGSIVVCSGQSETSSSQSTAQLLSDDTPELIDVLRSERCRLLKRIPKASRSLAADKLSTLLERIVADSDDIQRWNDLLRFSHACLAVPGGRGGRRHVSSLATKVNKALDMYTSAHQPNMTSLRHSDKKRSRRADAEANIAARVTEKLEDGDVRGAIRLASSDDTMAPHDQHTLGELRLKHPPRCHTLDDNHLPRTQDNHHSCQPLVVQESDVIEAVKSFPAGSAGGVDGMRPQHLKDLINVNTGDAGQRLVSRLTEFANICLAGKIPTSIRPIFCGASLCALNKKDGGIRPIAVGCTLRRLVAKIAAKSVQPKMAAKMAPTQLGFGVKQGTEAAAHAARRYIQQLLPGQALLKLDFVNAFNAISRNELLQIVIEEMPELYPFVSTCYSSSSHLFFGVDIIASEEGAQQGDPLGPLLFCAASLKLAKKMNAELNIWYMDDGTLGDDVEVLLNDLETVRQVGSALGLTLNEQKCELITDDQDVISKFKARVSTITVVGTSQAMLLGAPISDGIDAILTKKLIEFQRLAIRLKRLNAHDAFYLLKNCFSLPKLQYILRCSPCYQSDMLQQYDSVIRDTLQSILNVTLTDDAWMQATLPVKHGGIGIRLATQVSLPAYLSSVASSSELMLQLLPQRLHVTSGVNDLLFAAAVVAWKTTSEQDQLPENTVKQRPWDEPLISVAVKRVLSTAQTQAGLARLTAAAAPHSGAFLQTMPCSAVGTRLDDASLRIAIAIRLGAQVCSPHTCICGATVDCTGTHGLSCRKSAGRHMRHSALNDLVKRSLASAEIPARLEPSSLSRSDGKRPDGITMMPWQQGRCLVWDVTCPDTLAASHLNRAVTGHGAVANDAEQRKQLKYEAISQTHCFVPVAVETLGALGQEASDFLKDLGGRITAVTKERRAHEFLLQRVSVAVQRGNAACVLGTVGHNCKLDEIFYLL
jgi:Reverse transcriptase (RNA-dependent DNA polymerase)